MQHLQLITTQPPASARYVVIKAITAGKTFENQLWLVRRSPKPSKAIVAIAAFHLLALSILPELNDELTNTVGSIQEQVFRMPERKISFAEYQSRCKPLPRFNSETAALILRRAASLCEHHSSNAAAAALRDASSRSTDLRADELLLVIRAALVSENV